MKTRTHETEFIFRVKPSSKSENILTDTVVEANHAAVFKKDEFENRVKSFISALFITIGQSQFLIGWKNWYSKSWNQTLPHQRRGIDWKNIEKESEVLQSKKFPRVEVSRLETWWRNEAYNDEVKWVKVMKSLKNFDLVCHFRSKRLPMKGIQLVISWLIIRCESKKLTIEKSIEETILDLLGQVWDYVARYSNNSIISEHYRKVKIPTQGTEAMVSQFFCLWRSSEMYIDWHSDRRYHFCI